MSDDPSINWRQASPYAIRRPELPDYWEAGHVNDVLVRWTGSMQVAAQTGGVWSINEQGYSALPLSDSWAKPDLQCLALGPDGNDHVYAGGDGLYVTDTSAPVPLFEWHRLQSLDKVDPGTVQRIAILTSVRRIVVACSKGIFWSKIPPARPPSPGCLGALLGFSPTPWTDQYSWAKAQGAELPNGAFFGLALGWTGRGDSTGWQRDLKEIAVVVGGTRSARGIFVGQWDASDNLVMKRAHFSGALDLVQLEMAATDLTSCASQPQVLYAVASDDNGRIMIVLCSADGGRTWNPCGMKVKGGGDLSRDGGTQGQDGWNVCIGVSPFDPKLVAIGWQAGPFISDDSGQSWSKADGPIHGDIHRVYFDPRAAVSVSGGPLSERLFVATDGGVFSTDDRGHTFESRYNTHLLNLQFYGALGARESWGSAGAFSQFPSLVGGGLQDNGNCFAELAGATTPFLHLDDGDGGFFTPLATGQVLHDVGLQDTPQPVLASMWDATAHAFKSTVVIPVLKSKPPAPPDPNGLTSVNSLELVKEPRFHRQGRLMYAVASVGLDVFGLFALPNGDKIGWDYIGTAPAAAASTAWSVASVDGTAVFVGVDGPHIYSLDPANGGFVEYLYDSLVASSGGISRIVPYSNTRAFAIHNWTDPFGVSHGTILALEVLTWKPAGNGLPDETIFALEGARNIDNDILFAATDDRVFISYDEAKTWGQASKGLPRNPHCADLRFVKGPQGDQYIYLSSFGRSLWVANLLPDVRGTVHPTGGP